MTERQASAGVVPLFVARWSPRSFDQTVVPQDDLDMIFEAAGLAPSAFNYQPWRFLYAVRGDENWDRFVSLLIPFNARWATDAGALIYIVSDTLSRSGDKARANYSHSFDAGAAWALMALQATHIGYHAHGMTGIDMEKAQTELAIPQGYRLEAAVAIGRRASPDRLPEDLRMKETASDRKPIAETAFRGNFR
ncbi:nitroreductase family protein [Blastomonas fulva]|uniref:nitroreductase family protein n=1 Tax=Blastomonas fulva TaxID=1550728 RepID=UPI003F712F7D